MHQQDQIIFYKHMLTYKGSLYQKKKIVRYVTIWTHLRRFLYAKTIFLVKYGLFGTGNSIFSKMSTGIFFSLMGKVLVVCKGIPLRT